MRVLVCVCVHVLQHSLTIFFYAAHSFLSLALVARQNNYVKPTLTMEELLEIQNGRLGCPVQSGVIDFIAGCYFNRSKKS